MSKVAYYFNKEVGNFYYGPYHPMKPFRMKITHEMLKAYGVLPKFKHIENATVKHDLSKLIEALGDEIIYSTKCKKYNPMFKAFIEARPSIHSQFYKESKENDELRIGILALGFADFVMDDDTMSKFIKEMLKKGK